MADFSLDHVHVFTENMEQTIAFYRDVFHAKELRRIRKGNAQLVHMAVGSGRIVISEAADGKPPGIDHFAVAVEEPLEELVESLKEQGCTMETEIMSAGDYRTVFFRDRDGIRIELITPATS